MQQRGAGVVNLVVFEAEEQLPGHADNRFQVARRQLGAFSSCRTYAPSMLAMVVAVYRLAAIVASVAESRWLLATIALPTATVVLGVAAAHVHADTRSPG